MPDVPKAVETALDRVASRMTPVIRNRALEAGWPKDVVARMAMIRTANGISVHVDDEVRQQAEDLEFGSATSAPRSAFSTLYSPKTQKQMETIAGDSMDEILDQLRGMFK